MTDRQYSIAGIEEATGWSTEQVCALPHTQHEREGIDWENAAKRDRDGELTGFVLSTRQASTIDPLGEYAEEEDVGVSKPHIGEKDADERPGRHERPENDGRQVPMATQEKEADRATAVERAESHPQTGENSDVPEVEALEAATNAELENGTEEHPARRTNPSTAIQIDAATVVNVGVGAFVAYGVYRFVSKATQELAGPRRRRYFSIQEIQDAFSTTIDGSAALRERPWIKALPQQNVVAIPLLQQIFSDSITGRIALQERGLLPS